MIVIIIDSVNEYPKVQSLTLSTYIKNKDGKSVTELKSFPLVASNLKLTEDELIKLFEENTEDEKEGQGDKEPIYIFSYDPEKMMEFIEINELSNALPFYITMDKLGFKDVSTVFKKSVSEIVLPKLKVSSDKEVDILELSELFKINNTKTLKYINGNSTPLLLPYEGMSTINQIQRFKSGVLTPATELDSENLKVSLGEEPRLNLNETFIVQSIYNHSTNSREATTICYTVKDNSKHKIFWTEISEFDINEEFRESFGSNSHLLSDLTYFMIVEKHKEKYYINKIVQGIHPFYSFLPEGK